MDIKRLILKVACILTLLLGAENIIYFTAEVHALSLVLVQGAKGSSVGELQGRLRYLGLFKVDITEYYGPQTKAAVVSFQSKFGLKPTDGIAGPKTWDKLRSVTKNYKPSHVVKKPAIPLSSNGVSDAEKKLMAMIVYAEARGEIYEGQVAVVNVILNRVKSPKFPNTINGVIYQKGKTGKYAFSSVYSQSFKQGKYDATGMKAVNEACAGWNLVDGAVFFYEPTKAKGNKYMNSLPTVKWIGVHKFCQWKN